MALLSLISKKETLEKNVKSDCDNSNQINLITYTVLISIAITIIFLSFCLTPEISESIMKFTHSVNIFIYVASILIFTLSCILIVWLTWGYYNKDNNSQKFSLTSDFTLSTVKFCVLMLILLFLIFLIGIDAYNNMPKITYSESRIYLWRNIDQHFLLFLVLIILVVYLLLFEKTKNITLPRIISVILIIGCTLCTFYSSMYGNYLPSGTYFLHTDAIFQQIYNYYHGIYTNSMNFGLYGHYGILLSWVFKIIGFNSSKFVFVMAVLSSITVFANIYTIYNITNRIHFRITGAIFSLYLFSFMTVPTYQLIIRMIFPSIIIAILSYIAKNNKFNNKIFTTTVFLISGISFIWNTETGFVIIAAAVFFYLYYVFDKYKLNQKELYIKSAIYIVIGLFTLIASYSSVGLYNILLGGKFVSLHDFSPSLIGSKFVNNIQISLVGIAGLNVPWLYIFLLCLVFLGIGIIKSLPFGSKKKNSFSNLTFAIAIITIGCMTYFINRPAYGCLYVVYLLAIVLIVAVAELILKKSHSINSKTITLAINKCALYACSLVLLFGMIGTIINFINFSETRQKYKNDKSYSNLVNDIKNHVPPNTPALGMGISSIYCELGWDTKYYIVDLPSIALSEDAERYVLDIFKKADTPILITAGLQNCFMNFRPDILKTVQDNYDIAYTNNYCDGIELDYLIPKKH